MKIFIEILFLIVLGILFYQDMKEQKVSLWMLLLGLFSGGFLHFLHQDSLVFLSTILINLLFVSIIFSVLLLYSKFKLQKNIFAVFGLGDLLFFTILAVSLPILSFLMVFVFSTIFSLILFLILKKHFTTNTVPLAGLQSLFLAIVLIINTFIDSVNIYAM